MILDEIGEEFAVRRGAAFITTLDIRGYTRNTPQDIVIKFSRVGEATFKAVPSFRDTAFTGTCLFTKFQQHADFAEWETLLSIIGDEGTLRSVIAQLSAF